jgi:large subunit ribosomal protein L24
MKIRKGDLVKMIKGKDRGRTGVVLRALPKVRKVVVEGLNLIKKHKKARKEGEEGGIISVPRPVPVANVKLVCPKCKTPTRIKMERKNGKKKRICKKCQSYIDEER